VAGPGVTEGARRATGHRFGGQAIVIYY